MIRSLDIIMNDNILHTVQQAGSDQEIIDPPTHIPPPGSGYVCPPGILDLIRVDLPVNIDQPGLQVSIDHFAFFR